MKLNILIGDYPTLLARAPSMVLPSCEDAYGCYRTVRWLSGRRLSTAASSMLLPLGLCDGANRECQKAHAKQCRAQKEKSNEVALRSVLDHSHDVGTKKAA